MTLDSWIAWAFRPHNGRHSFHSWTLCRQAARDLGVPVDHAEFIAAMQRAGYRVTHRYGSAVYFNAIDSADKRQYYRRRYIGADDRVRHPLVK